MRVIEPWVAEPLQRFLAESSARLVLLTTSSGQVVAQHGFTRALDVMSASALGAAIMASTEELGRLSASGASRAVSHQGPSRGLFLSAFDLPQGRWIGLVVYDRDSSLGLVRLFFDRMVTELLAAAPARPPAREVLAADFENELNASLRSLFGR
jgi:hypothetical protein